MMRVRWTANAANDLAGIVNYIRKDNPEAARLVGHFMLCPKPRE